jgi:glycosyltransferase involved in cell wall biosynthesis
VVWLGAAQHSTVRSWLQRASVFCLPSCTALNGDSEGLPISLLEANASGIAVVATRHAGIPEAVVDGDTGLLVGERDASALAEALDALLSSESQRQAFGARAREMTQKRFDLFRQTHALEQLYEGVL